MKRIPDIYAYTDYRTFLADYYRTFKDADPEFSFRTMARSMGFTSPNFLKLVIDGEREIGKNSVKKVIEGVGLKKNEARYFSYLVFFRKAKTILDKNYYFGLITSLRAAKLVATIQPSQYEYYNDWYTIVVREMVEGKIASTLDHRELAKKIIPPVLPKQVKKALNTLTRIGLLSIDSHKRYRQSASLINTPDELNSFVVKKYHCAMIELARKSLDTFPPEKREFSACTVKVSGKGFDTLKRRIQEFREELLQIVDTDDAADRVAQINIQLFPLSQEGV